MEKLSPPFKVDIAGTFCRPAALKQARQQYRHEQINLPALQAIEDAEIRNLIGHLKSEGMKVVTDGGFRKRDFLEGWEGINVKPDTCSSDMPCLELTGRISLSHHPILDDYRFLSEAAGEDVMTKQHIPSPGKLLTKILRETDASLLKQIYPDVNALSDDVAAAYKTLLTELYSSGCRYVQFDGAKSLLMDEAVRLNNRVLRERPEGLFIAFHAATDMLIRLHGADAYFLNYDCGICDRSRLLWFVREKEAVFGFVLSYYPEEDELDELQAKIEEVLNYIPLKRFTLCLPDADNLLNPSDTDEEKQWRTVKQGMEMAERLF